MEITQNSQSLHFDSHGLIPAIVQDHYTKEVLTLAYMNAETLAQTIAEGRTVFWSRSRQEMWRNGEPSGNVHHGGLRQGRAGHRGGQERPGLPYRGGKLFLQPGVCVRRTQTVHLAGAV